MNRKSSTILLIILVVISSIFTYYAANLLFSDVSNFGMGFKDINFISSIPMLMIMCECILSTIYLTRYIVKSQYKKALTKKYFIIFACFSFVGIISSILSGTIIYHSFLKPYPFPFYSLVMLVVHIIFVIVSIYFYVLTSKRMEEDAEKRPFSVLYVLKTITASLFFYVALERLGTFFYSPLFIQLRTLDLTWPFILSLPVPMSILAESFLCSYDAYKKKPIRGVIHSGINLFLAISLNLSSIIIGYFDSRIIAAVSPGMALDRLASAAIIMGFFTAGYVIVGTIGFIWSLKIYLKAKKDAETISN